MSPMRNVAGNKLGGYLEEIFYIQAQTSPYFQLREKFKCIEHIDKSEIQLEISP